MAIQNTLRPPETVTFGHRDAVIVGYLLVVFCVQMIVILQLKSFLFSAQLPTAGVTKELIIK